MRRRRLLLLLLRLPSNENLALAANQPFFCGAAGKTIPHGWRNGARVRTSMECVRVCLLTCNTKTTTTTTTGAAAAAAVKCTAGADLNVSRRTRWRCGPGRGK